MKKKYANLIMIGIIAVVLTGGILLALRMAQEQNTQPQLGSEVSPSPAEENIITISDDPQNLCTVTIVCSTILDNIDKLEEAKAPYVPADGILLPETTVEFAEGETVFAVLQRACEASDIQLEYSWTPLYDSYYIEGIGHLYGFDCGFESGWMYKVNDWFPNYGCSAYELQGGENIVWCYTCVGLGADVGGNNWQE
jgi:hypothetical protein